MLTEVYKTGKCIQFLTLHFLQTGMVHNILNSISYFLNTILVLHFQGSFFPAFPHLRYNNEIVSCSNK